MSTPYVGISNYLPQIAPFKPDLNFYSDVLSTKQARYDAAYQKMSSLYSSVLNSPMLKDSNIKRRDDFLKAVNQDIQKVAALDLSKQENVELASKVFEPFYNDKHIIHDIAFTRGYQNELSKGESFRNCVDPDKCGGSYWDKGIQALHYKAEEYKNADPNEALKMSSPRFTPFINLTQKAMKAAKDAGFNIEVDSVNGGYIVTDKNGKLLLTDQNGGPGVLPQFLYGMFGNDQGVQDVFNTQAYVQRKDFSKSNATQFGSEEAAESFYLNDIIKKSVPALEKAALASKNQLDYLDAQKKILQGQIQARGIEVAGSDESTSLELLDALYEHNKNVTGYHENILNEIKTAPYLEDLQTLRMRADKIVANSYFQNTLNSAAYDYAMGTAKRELKADPYALERFRTSQNIYEHGQKMALEHEYWKARNETTFAQQLALKDSGMSAQGLSQNQKNQLKGLGYSDAEINGLNVQDTEYLINQGVLTPEGQNVTLLGNQGSEKVTTNYRDNLDYFTQESQNNFAKAHGNINQLLTSLVKQYDSAVNSPDKSQAIIIKKSLDNILAKTPLKNANALLSDRRNFANNLQKLVGPSAANAQASAEREFKNPVNKFWKNILDQNLVNNISSDNVAQDAVEGLGKVFSNNVVQAIKNKVTGISPSAPKTDILHQGGLYQAMLNTKTGLLNTSADAEKTFIKNAPKYFQTIREINHTKEGPYETIITPEKQASDYFKKHYDEFRKGVEDDVPGVKDFYRVKEGGVSAPMYGKQYNVSGNQRGGANIFAQNLTTLFKQNPSAVSGVTNEELANTFFNYYDQALQSGDKDFGFKLTVSAQDKRRVDGEDLAPGTVYKIDLNPDVAKKIYGKNYEATQDYSFEVKIPTEFDPNRYAERIKLNPVDAYMKLAGSNLTIDQGAGKYVLMNDGKNIVGYPVFNYLTGDTDANGMPINLRYETVTGNSDVISPQVSANEAIKQGKEYLEMLQQRNEALIQALKNNQ